MDRQCLGHPKTLHEISSEQLYCRICVNPAAVEFLKESYRNKTTGPFIQKYF